MSLLVHKAGYTGLIVVLSCADFNKSDHNQVENNRDLRNSH